MIIAVDQGNAIGWKDGRLPWKIPADLKLFREKTLGSTVVMGRSTYQSLNMSNGLPGRRNVVLTRKPYSEVRGQFGDVEVISSLDWVQKFDRRNKSGEGALEKEKTFWIIGGASVYAEAIARNMLDELHVTFVQANSGADVVLPFDLYSWKLFMLRQRKEGVYWCESERNRLDSLDSSPSAEVAVFRKL